jgi:creatinine amidohydrolase
MSPLTRSENECRYPYLSPKELISRLSAKAILYLPIGSLEWHNEHLPLGTDTFHAMELSLRLCTELGGVVLPAFWWNSGGWPHPSTYLMPQPLYRAVLKNVCLGLRPVPAILLVLVNGHGSTFQNESIAVVAGELNDSDFPMHVILADPYRLGTASSCRLDHADTGETSFSLEMIPQLVRMDRDIGPDLLSGQKPFAQGQPDRTGGRELWLACLEDAKTLIANEYARLKPATPLSAEELWKLAWGLPKAWGMPPHMQTKPAESTDPGADQNRA